MWVTRVFESVKLNLTLRYNHTVTGKRKATIR
jgi:hypothetical protein